MDYTSLALVKLLCRYLYHTTSAHEFEYVLDMCQYLLAVARKKKTRTTYQECGESAPRALRKLYFPRTHFWCPLHPPNSISPLSYQSSASQVSLLPFVPSKSRRTFPSTSTLRDGNGMSTNFLFSFSEKLSSHKSEMAKGMAPCKKSLTNDEYARGVFAISLPSL